MPPSARLSAVALPPGPLTERSPAELLFRLLFEAQCTCAKAAPVPPETLTPVSLPLLVCKFSDPPCLPRVLCPQAERSWSYLRKHPLSPRTLATAWFVFNRWVPGKARLKGAEALRVRGPWTRPGQRHPQGLGACSVRSLSPTPDLPTSNLHLNKIPS